MEFMIKIKKSGIYFETTNNGLKITEFSDLELMEQTNITGLYLRYKCHLT